MTPPNNITAKAARRLYEETVTSHDSTLQKIFEAVLQSCKLGQCQARIYLNPSETKIRYALENSLRELGYEIGSTELGPNDEYIFYLLW